MHLNLIGSEKSKELCCGKLFLLCISCFLVGTGQIHSLPSPLLYPENPGKDFVLESRLSKSAAGVLICCTWCSFTTLYFFLISCWSPFSYPILNIFVVSVLLCLFLFLPLLLISPSYLDRLHLGSDSDLERDLYAHEGARGSVVPPPGTCLSGSHSDKAQKRLELCAVEHISCLCLWTWDICSEL